MKRGCKCGRGDGEGADDTVKGEEREAREDEYTKEGIMQTAGNGE